MAQPIEILCEALEEEARRQTVLLQVCRDQRAALTRNDVDATLVTTRRLERILQEHARAEFQRHTVMRKAREELNLPAADRSLSPIIAVVGSPWRERLTQARKSLRMAAEESRVHLREIHRGAALGLAMVRESLAKAVPDGFGERAYGHPVQAAAAAFSLGRMDQRG